MKKISIFLILLAAVAFLFIMTGCEDDSGMSIDDRIEAFVSDLNDSNRDGIFKDHFHSDSSSYSGSESTVNGVFPNVNSGAGYSYTQTSISGSGSSRSVYIDDGGDGSATGTYTFNMKEEDSDDWYILNLDGTGGSL